MKTLWKCSNWYRINIYCILNGFSQWKYFSSLCQNSFFFCFKVNLNQRGVGVKVLLEFSDVFNLFHFFNLLFWWCTQNYGLISWFFWATKSGNSSTDHQDTKCRNNPKSIDHNVSSVPNERVTVIDLGGPFIYYVSTFPGFFDPLPSI